MSIVSIRDLVCVRGTGATSVRALAGISLDVRLGELVAVMGPSGSGKSTLLNAVGGLIVPTSGSVMVDDQSLSSLGRSGRAAIRRRGIGFVFQELNLIPSLTAAENVALPRELDGVRRAAAREEAVMALFDVGLEGFEDRYPNELSGGQQQRVAIARALVGPRRLVLADEPTGALDSVAGDDVMRLLRTRIDEGAAGLLVTHDARFAAWADRTVFLRDGRIVDTTGDAAGPESLLASR
ncbi:ABC transporter ATP-binding protein [Cellulomonas sp. McL0617]|uniref:ABC transporter ATP-binding protein n=1 Tax=Cellulomonas sp. McL0617 TaxID=3415675 RepID=UPI003CF142C6